MAPKVGPRSTISPGGESKAFTRKVGGGGGHLTHAIRTVNLRKLHATNNQTRHDLPSPLDDGILSRLHIKPAHATKLLELLHADEPLDGEGAKGAVVTRRRDDDRRVDGVGVHAGLVIVVHRHERPVGHHARDTYATVLRATTSDQVLDARRVEELDVGEGEHLGQHRGGEERGVLDDDEVALVLEGDADLAQEHVGRLAHHHGGEELPAEPGAAAGRDARLDEGDAQVGPQRGEHVRRAQAA